MAVALAALLPALAVAQTTPDIDDYIVTGFTSTGGQLLQVKPTSTGAFTTLRTFPNAVGRATGVTMDEDNRSLAVLLEVTTGSQGRLVRFEPGPTPRLTTLLNFSTSSTATQPTSACWTRDGDMVISVANGYLLRYAPEVPFRFTTLYRHTFPVSQFRHVATAPGPNWDFVVVNGTYTPYLFGVNSSGTLVRSFTPHNLSEAVAGSYDHGTGLLAVTRQDSLRSLGDFLLVSAGTGALSTVAPLAFMPMAHRYTQRDTYVVLGTAGTVQELDRRGAAIRTIKLKVASGFLGTGLEVYGNNRLHVDTSYSPRRVVLNLNDPSAARKAYSLAIALTSLGGMSLPTQSGLRRLNLNPDPLFLLSLLNMLPGVLGNTTGILDGTGHATVVINPPAGLGGRHLVLYAAWVSYDKTGIFSVSETEYFVLP